MINKIPRAKVLLLVAALINFDVMAGDHVFCAFTVSGNGFGIGDGEFSGIVYFNIKLGEYSDKPNGLRQYSITDGQANIVLDTGNIVSTGEFQYLFVGDNVNETSDVVLGRFSNPSSSGNPTVEITEFRLTSLDTSTISGDKGSG